VKLAGRSLSGRLLLVIALVSAGYWVVMTAWTLSDSIGTVNEIFDAHLAQTALAVLRVTDPDDDDDTTIPKARPPGASLGDALALLPHLPQRLAQLGLGAGPAVAGSLQALHEDYERQLRYQVFAGDGTLLLRSANAPEEPMARADGFSDAADAQGRVWRHYAVWDRHRDYRVLVSEAHDLRERLVRRLATQTATPLALGLPLLLLLVWAGVRGGLDPLGALARDIRSRRADDLRPLDAEAAPREVQPLVSSLNSLLERFTHMLDGERRFTADAAHELRTPLAAMQAHLHLALRTEGVERERALAHLQQSVDRGSRVVGQLLTLARLDPETAPPDACATDLRAIAQTVCAELAPVAMRRRQELELECSAADATLLGNADLLSMLLRNLIENAIRYTPPGGHIEVRLSGGGPEDPLCLEVRDDGPGVPVAQRARLFDRFYRVPGNETSGTGLGLPICRRIAELHQARIELGDGLQGRGLAVRISFAALV